MLDILRREGVYLWYYSSVQFEQIFKYWVLGIVLGSVISVFGKSKIHSLLLIINRKRLGLFGLFPCSNRYCFPSVYVWDHTCCFFIL